jgi:hypothetical protein
LELRRFRDQTRYVRAQSFAAKYLASLTAGNAILLPERNERELIS